VAKSKGKKGMTTQLNVRVPVDLADRIDETAVLLATDRSHLLRIIIAEKLHEYEERARLAKKKEAR
jgi:metal-responsive CopG/Arc/MetJ family transcriptional regulator